MADQNDRPVSIADWMISLILLSIPIVNIVLCFWWAFSGGTPVSKANFAKAMLMFMVIVIALYVFLIGSMLSNSPY
jgi:hypothetical protein